MLRLASRLAALAVAAVTISALSGCGETNAPPQASVPPPPPAQEAPPPELLGGPPPRDFAPMAPIPNPEDMTPAERARVYGAHYFWRRHLRLMELRAAHRPHVHARWSAAHPIQAAGAAPIPPAVKAPAPVAVATPALTPVQKLQAAVSGVGKTAVLAAPSDLSASKPGKVTLSLPANLFDAIRAEAAKLGLIKAARKTEVTATLSGDGYIITPNGPQTAPLKAGKAATFTWQVLPGANARGALKADVSAVLKGAGAAESISLAHLEQTVAAVEAATAADAAKAQASQGMGRLKSSPVFWGVVALLVLIVLGVFGRAGANRREAEERRRRLRAVAAATSLHEDDLHPVVAAPVVVEAPAPAPQPVAAEPAHVEPVATPVHVETAEAPAHAETVDTPANVEPEAVHTEHHADPAEHKAEDLETV